MSKRLTKAERRKQMLELFIPAFKPLKHRTVQQQTQQMPFVKLIEPSNPVAFVKLTEQVKNVIPQSTVVVDNLLPTLVTTTTNKKIAAKIAAAADVLDVSRPPAIPSYPPPALPLVSSLLVLPAKPSTSVNVVAVVQKMMSIDTIDVASFVNLQSSTSSTSPKVDDLQFDDGLQFKNAKIPIVDTVLTAGKSRFAYSFFEWNCTNSSLPLQMIGEVGGGKKICGIPLQSGEEYLLHFEIVVTPTSDVLSSATNADSSDNATYRHECSVIVCIIDGKASCKQISASQSTQNAQRAKFTPSIIVRCETYDKVNSLLIPKITCITDEQQKLVCSFVVYVSKHTL